MSVYVVVLGPDSQSYDKSVQVFSTFDAAEAYAKAAVLGNWIDSDSYPYIYYAEVDSTNDGQDCLSSVIVDDWRESS